MSEAKFTKGEWIVIDNGYFFDVHALDKDDTYINQACMGVSYEDEENAHLIAAAPEMYEMLDYVQQQLSGVEETICWNEVKELLAKARGEQ